MPLIRQETEQERRILRLAGLWELLGPPPEEWVGEVKHDHSQVGATLQPEECTSYRTLITAWRKAMQWTEGLDHALCVMLASITSTDTIGDQLWIKVMGPPACGKSTLCEALSVSKDFVVAKSTIRGFHSGYKTDREGEEDNSLIIKLYGKTLVTKDSDAMFSGPASVQIMGEARDIYDRVSRSHYKNKMGKDYTGCNMTWLLCGTSALRMIDESELGERFLDCVIMDKVDDELEDEVLVRLVHRAQRTVSMLSDGKAETQYEPAMAEAMQLTGGYVNYLRRNAIRLLSGITASDEALLRCARLGKFVAYMRSRPSKKQNESAEREMGTRLASQLVRVANCMAVVLNRRSLDEEVMERTNRVALDTARGIALDIVRESYRAGRIDGVMPKQMAIKLGQREEFVKDMMYFMRRIGAMETFNQEHEVQLGARPRWRMSNRMHQLYSEVVVDSGQAQLIEEPEESYENYPTYQEEY